VSSSDDVTVYVVDDHDFVRLQLIDLVDSTAGFVVVGSADDVTRAVTEIERLGPRVALVDGHIGEGDGLDVCRQLAVLAPDVACVIITAGVAVEWGPVEAAQAGAAALLLKQIKDFPLIATIARVAAGERLLNDYLVPKLPPESSGDAAASGVNL